MKPIQLTIPTPCYESWDKMTPKDQGRHCTSCAKVVVDFSAMSDAQMIQYFENLKTENVCGRVYTNQLNRTIAAETVAQPRKQFAWYWQIAAAFSIFFFKSQAVKAQGKIALADTSKKIKEINDIPIMLGGIRRVYPNNVTQLPAKLTQIFITDENKNTVPFASVQLLPDGKWMVADSTGKFNLDKNHTIERVKVSAVGFEEKIFELRVLESNHIILKQLPALMGEVVVACNTLDRIIKVGTINVSRVEKIEQKETVPLIANKHSTSDISIFPNPAAKGQFVTIQVASKQPAEFLLLINDAQGKTKLQQNINVVSKTQPLKFKIPTGWSSGQYFVSLRSAKTETLQTASLLVL